MTKINDILNFLNERFPFESACDFDNVGLLVGDRNDTVKKVLICLDCDMGAVNAAAEIGANLIITHHPVIFDGLKTVTSDSVVFSLIKNGISVISMHTNLDIAKGGVTETLCSLLGAENIENFLCEDGFLIRKCTFGGISADQLAKKIKATLGYCVRYCDNKRPINTALVCSGSGGNYVADAIKGGFDAVITADVKHNHFIDAINHGVCEFDAGHFASENIIVPILLKLLGVRFPEIQFEIHNLDTLKNI